MAIAHQPTDSTLCRHLVVLGSSSTALAVVHGCFGIGISMTLIDCDEGIAFRSSIKVELLLCRGLSESSILQLIAGQGAKQQAALLATSDYWLSFVVRHSGAIRSAFMDVLHPADDCIETTLDKASFACWCERHGINSPALVHRISASDYPSNVGDSGVIARPQRTLHGTDIAKAVVVTSPGQLAEFLEKCTGSHTDVVLTRLIDPRHLRLYSLCVARALGREAHFLAERKRPPADYFQSGSFVCLAEDTQAIALGLKVAHLLNIYGLAEIEIAFDSVNKQFYVLEVNCRPWTFLRLGEITGINLLHCLIMGRWTNPVKRARKRGCWISTLYDAYVCFGTNVGLYKKKRMAILPFLYSLMQVGKVDLFSWRDPIPFLSMLVSLLFPEKQHHESKKKTTI